MSGKSLNQGNGTQFSLYVKKKKKMNRLHILSEIVWVMITMLNRITFEGFRF